MSLLNSLYRAGLAVAVGGVLVACQTVPAKNSAQLPVSSSVSSSGESEGNVSFSLPQSWGGEVRCGNSGCLLAAVEHQNNVVVLHRLQKDAAPQRLSVHDVPYHPDSAVWLSDDLIAAAVENAGGLEILQVKGDKLISLQTLPAGFGPRDVMLVGVTQGVYRLLATPYIGEQVAWIDWSPDAPTAFKVHNTKWCKSPWHPAKVSRLPNVASGGGVAVACLDDRRVVAVTDANLFGAPQVLATFSSVPRQARPSPLGTWLYVALETGGKNARINMTSGELQWIEAPPTGAVAVAPISEDLVLWADDGRLYLQQLDAQGVVLETRDFRTSGFSTSVQLIDVNADGHPDAVVLNTAGEKADIIYGPLWEKAAKSR